MQPGQDEQLIDLMLEEIAAAPDADERAGLLVDLADVLEKSGDLDRAVNCLEAAREESPDRPGLDERLSAGLERCGRYSDLADLLADRLERTPPGDDRAALARRLADVSEVRLADPARAQIAWRAVLAERPSDREALSALARLLAAGGQLRERLVVLRQLAQATESNSERAALHRELAAGHADLGELEAAAEHLEWSLASEDGTADDLRNLARMYLALGRTRAAIDAHIRRAALESGRERARVLLEIAALFEGALHDASRAIDFCMDAEAAAPQDSDGLRALIRLYEKREDHDAAVAALERLAARATAPVDRAETLTRAGRIAERNAEIDEAVRLYETALLADQTSTIAARRLAGIHRERGEVAEAARLIVHALAHCEASDVRAELAQQAGELHEQLGDLGGAVAFYRDALDSDGNLVAAATRLSELLWQDDLHGEVVGVLEDLCRMDPLADRPVALERATRLAHAYGALGLDRRALAAVRRAITVAPDGRVRRDLMRREGELCARLAQWPEASAAFERVLSASGELPLELTLGERVELHHGAGVAAARIAQPELASRRLGEALALDPQHRASLTALLELVRGEPRMKLDILRALSRQVEGSERAQLLVEIGDLLAEELRRPADALASYREALAIAPGDHILIHKCMGPLMEAEQWGECRTLFDRLITTEEDALVRAKYTHAAALLCLEELDQREEAIRLLWTALDDDPGLTAAQQALENILREGGSWQALGNLYCKLIAHVGQDSADSEDAGRRELRLRLWSNLGELCWTRLDQKDSAIDAFDVASRLAPDDVERLRSLAERATQAGPAHRARAIAAHQRLLALGKQRATSYQALSSLYEQNGLERHARACAHALAFTLPADGSGARPRPRAGGIDVADRVLTGEMWSHLRHPDEDPIVDAALTLIAPVAAASGATTIKRLALELGGADPLPTDSQAGRVLGRVAGMLGVPRPLALACPETRVGLDVRVIVDRGAVRPVLIFGGPLLQGVSERPLAFHIGRALASLRGGGIIRFLLPRHDQISLLLEAAAHLGRGGAAEPAAVASTARSLEKALGARELEQLTVLGKRLRDRALLSEAAARDWLRAHDLSLTRVGLVACGDLATSLEVMGADAPSAGRHPAGVRAQELIWSSATEPVLEVRAHLEDWYAPEEEIAIMSRDIIVSSAL
jgi:tetratricopeptide (TPR) repeat protein